MVRTAYNNNGTLGQREERSIRQEVGGESASGCTRQGEECWAAVEAVAGESRDDDHLSEMI